ncbi:alpha/beta hydrolase [Staphylococcus pseudintermedius]|uniref:alpha/beta hydrolase n=1 Tax=Staphylococcus pseudintermedius TaxID=283734 RepID=UPI000CDE9B4E|nr:alpha/beta hydrolase [Staphylococcus pseudintermedius]POY94519.1 lysophospholipase [Staphylococcus pseudintermedius]
MVKSEAMKIAVTDGTMIEAKVDRTDYEAVGIVHIFHGMAEHMDRYVTLVDKLNQQGYHVIRHNHRGHGCDVDGIRGHFDSITQVVQDAFEIQSTLKAQFNPHLPLILIGHSMGSIIARQFVQTYPQAAQGLILSGTGYFPTWYYITNLPLLKIITLVCGKKRRMNWLNQMTTGRFNKNFKPTRTTSDWLSSDKSEVDHFIQDPHTGFLVSNQLIFSVLQTMMRTSRVKNIAGMNLELPILLISGKDDPFGANGKGIRRFGKILKRGGIHHITVQLYKNKRHEVLFEKDKETVWRHMLDWMSRQIIKKQKVGERGVTK